jgi:hypothetical protein
MKLTVIPVQRNMPLRHLRGSDVLTTIIAALSGGIVESSKDQNPGPQERGRGFTIYYLVEDVEKVRLCRLCLV